MKEKVEKLEKGVESLKTENEIMKETFRELKENIEKLDEEAENLKEGVENLEEDVESLKAENGKVKEKVKWSKNNVGNLKACNDNLKKNAEKLKKKVEKLEENVESLETENRKGKEKCQLSNLNPIQENKLVTKEDRLIEGVSRFIEGIEPKTKTYDSYVQWYDDISNRVEHGGVYKYSKYLFSCNKQFSLSNAWVSLISHSDQTSKITFIGTFIVNNLQEEWTHENTRLVFILHPKHPHKFVELDQKGIQRDEVGNVLSHTWITHRDNITTSWNNDEFKIDQTKNTCWMILCCIKH